MEIEHLQIFAFLQDFQGTKNGLFRRVFRQLMTPQLKAELRSNLSWSLRTLLSCC